MDAKARVGFIVTPVRHVETMGALEDEELYCLWRVGLRALRSEGLQPVNMIVNHGCYRNLPHLHLKIWVDDGMHRQARLKWNDDKKRVWARLECLTSSSLSKKSAFYPGFERQDMLAKEKSLPIIAMADLLSDTQEALALGLGTSSTPFRSKFLNLQVEPSCNGSVLQIWCWISNWI